MDDRVFTVTPPLCIIVEIALRSTEYRPINTIPFRYPSISNAHPPNSVIIPPPDGVYKGTRAADGRDQKAIRRKTGWGLEPNRYQFRPRPSPVLLIFDFVSPLSTSKSPPNGCRGGGGGRGTEPVECPLGSSRSIFGFSNALETLCVNSQTCRPPKAAGKFWYRNTPVPPSPPELCGFGVTPVDFCGRVFLTPLRVPPSPRPLQN